MLKQLVKGSWREKQERKIDWKEWEADIVGRFIHWLYTDDYECPYPAKAPGIALSSDPDVGKGSDDVREEAIAEIEVLEAEPSRDILDPMSGWANFGATSKSSRSKKGYAWDEEQAPAPLLTPLDELDWSGKRNLRKVTQAEEFETWTSDAGLNPSELDYKATFLTHAKLYVMARHYMLEDLKNMTLHRLRSTLKSIGMLAAQSPVVENLVTLVRYVYDPEHTAKSDDDEVEPLRNLIITFIAHNVTNFKSQDDEVEGLFFDGGDFVNDLVEKLSCKIAQLEGQKSVSIKISKKGKKSKGRLEPVD